MISGYGNGKFGPNDELTYNQAVTLLVKALGYEKTAVFPAGHNSSIWMDPERSFITYIAVWEAMPSAGTAIIEYNANGGVGAPVSHSATIGDDGTTIFNLSTTIPSRDGFNFLGWRLYNDPAYGIDSPGQTITIGLTPCSSTTLTYWAQWENTKAVPKWYRPNLSGSGGRPGDPMYVTLKFDYPITELGFWVVRESDDAVVFCKSFSHVSGPSEFEYVIPYTEAGIYTIHGYVIINGQRYEAYPIWTNKNLAPWE